MRTMQLQQAHGAAHVAERHQFFPKHFYAPREIAQVVREAYRLPKAAQVLAAGCAGPTWVSSVSSSGTSRWK